MLSLSTPFSCRELSPAGVRNAILYCSSKLPARVQAPVHLCVFCCPLDNIYVCTCPCCYFSEKVRMRITCLFPSSLYLTPDLRNLCSLYCSCLESPREGGVETLSFFMWTFSSKTSALPSWHNLIGGGVGE